MKAEEIKKVGLRKVATELATERNLCRATDLVNCIINIIDDDAEEPYAYLKRRAEWTADELKSAVGPIVDKHDGLIKVLSEEIEAALAEN